tara:strand:+ start:5933 stop:6595 length:663 start_codon:yes stop_codon:yes gene_type:complete
MTPVHHVAPEMLLDYASGSMPEPMALLVASHASLCSRCAEQICELEAVGGELIDSLKPEAMAEGALNGLLARIGKDGYEVEPFPEQVSPVWVDPRVPSPLHSYIPKSLDNLDWVRRAEGIEQARLLNDFAGFDTRLFRLAPDVTVPRHTHEGEEATLVLTGGFSDADGHYVRGDVAMADPSVTHRPIADPGEPCINLAVTTGSLRLPGLVGQLIKPFVKL